MHIWVTRPWWFNNRYVLNGRDHLNHWWFITNKTLFNIQCIFFEQYLFTCSTAIHARTYISWGHWVIKSVSHDIPHVRIYETWHRYILCLLFYIHCVSLTKRGWSIHFSGNTANRSKTGMNMLHMNKQGNDPFHPPVIITQYMQVSSLYYWGTTQLSHIVTTAICHGIWRFP